MSVSQETLVIVNCPSQRTHFPNVLIVGETGAGKSSVVNLIAGKQLAPVSSGASGCTLEATSYDVSLTDRQGSGHHVRLFDTVGLNEPNLSKSSYLSAVEQANVLITQLWRTGGIRLLIFCIRGGRITAVTQSNYYLFRYILCQNQVPVAFVITGMELEQPMNAWWDRNASIFKRVKLFCDLHVCVTATRGYNDAYNKQYEASRIAIRDMLLDHMSTTSWKPEHTSWFINLAGMLLRFVAKITRSKQHPTWRKNLTVEELARSLEDKCRFDRNAAVELAHKIITIRVEDSFVKVEGGDLPDIFH